MKYPFDCISDFVFVKNQIEKADVILVPGSRMPQAMIKAVELFQEGYAPYLLPSGGPNPRLKEFPTEWASLRKVALERGVPENAILKEDKAANTFENARFSLKVLKENGIPFKKVLLVCKAYHSRRALLTYQTVFPSDTVFYVTGVTDYRGIRRDNWHMREDWIRIVMGEVVKIGNYFETEIPGLAKKFR